MKATSAGYATLVAIYRTKAKKDLADVQKCLSEVLEKVGLPNDGKFITEEMLNVFVKNAAFVELVRGRKMRDEYEAPLTKKIGKFPEGSVNEQC